MVDPDAGSEAGADGILGRQRAVVGLKEGGGEAGAGVSAEDFNAFSKGSEVCVIGGCGPVRLSVCVCASLSLLCRPPPPHHHISASLPPSLSLSLPPSLMADLVGRE